eukprot:CAMPEP_0172569620 /NCGR_PEP_ID=MMETSP1067-20121228/124251_1 /TAXON_ID=265564 ORGANISM="Thalassiosira punctigera, Strain Tpunct2005C2" /NCGR_SAMPLE_ID=MMETSP1067 /ASSEMBLY_ACC=CAM_ASM_000444 /LENGTH=39 /DNA_ID= /DNA_START= /DNA_END= /DNA_ORIENTATION=
MTPSKNNERSGVTSFHVDDIIRLARLTDPTDLYAWMPPE